MSIERSNFISDLEKEQSFTRFLDSLYTKNLSCYTFQRVTDRHQQLLGIDVIFKHHKTGKTYFIDEKAQLDYPNKELPTFAFELSYLKDKVEKKGWLFDNGKKTHFYALATAIFYENGQFSSCKITLVNRQKLIAKLAEIGFNLENAKRQRDREHGPIDLTCFSSRKQGYLFFSKNNKAEQPLNLVLKLNWLIDIGVAKRLV